MKKQIMTIIMLAILLIASLGYIGVSYWQEKKQAELTSVYQQGISDAVVSVFQQTDDCKAPTVTLGNFTRQIVDVACLKTGA